MPAMKSFRGIVATDGNAGTAAHCVGQRAPAMPHIDRVQQTIAVVFFGALDEEASRSEVCATSLLRVTYKICFGVAPYRTQALSPQNRILHSLRSTLS